MIMMSRINLKAAAGPLLCPAPCSSSSQYVIAPAPIMLTRTGTQSGHWHGDPDFSHWPPRRECQWPGTSESDQC